MTARDREVQRQDGQLRREQEAERVDRFTEAPKDDRISVLRDGVTLTASPAIMGHDGRVWLWNVGVTLLVNGRTVYVQWPLNGTREEALAQLRRVDCGVI